MASLFQFLCRHFRTSEPLALEVDGLVLRLVDGQLFLPASDARATALAAVEETERDDRLRALARELAGRPYETRDANHETEDEVGPFQAAYLVAELAVLGARPARLEARLGGGDALLRSVMPTVATALPLGPESVRLVDRLSQPARLNDLLRTVPGPQQPEVLGQLAVLHALGLVQRSDEASVPKPSRDPLTARLSERIAARLADHPPTESPAIQRQKIAEIWQRQGELDHYQLLDVPRHAAATAVTEAFDRLALLAHPSNAVYLGLPPDDAMLSALFDRAVEAYRTLIDPDLRIAYNRIALPEAAPEVDRDVRETEKQQVADEHVRRALFHLQQQDVSMAVDLLKEAARLAPSADTWATLARAQARNPGWRRHAAQSWREALALRPEWVEAYCALAETLEAMGDEKGAAEQYRKALQLAPGDGKIQVALGRLGSAPATESGRRSGWLRRPKLGSRGS